VIIVSTRVAFLRVWRHWLHFSTKTGTKRINGGRKFSEIKVQKTWSLMFVISWNFARSFGKTHCARECKKNGYRRFDLSGTLSTNPYQSCQYCHCTSCALSCVYFPLFCTKWVNCRIGYLDSVWNCFVSGFLFLSSLHGCCKRCTESHSSF